MIYDLPIGCGVFVGVLTEFGVFFPEAPPLECEDLRPGYDIIQIRNK